MVVWAVARLAISVQNSHGIYRNCADFNVQTEQYAISSRFLKNCGGATPRPLIRALADRYKRAPAAGGRRMSE